MYCEQRDISVARELGETYRVRAGERWGTI
jgi:hypothetical protein